LSSGGLAHDVYQSDHPVCAEQGCFAIFVWTAQPPLLCKEGNILASTIHPRFNNPSPLNYPSPLQLPIPASTKQFRVSNYRSQERNASRQTAKEKDQKAVHDTL